MLIFCNMIIRCTYTVVFLIVECEITAVCETRIGDIKDSCVLQLISLEGSESKIFGFTGLVALLQIRES